MKISRRKIRKLIKEDKSLLQESPRDADVTVTGGRKSDVKHTAVESIARRLVPDLIKKLKAMGALEQGDAEPKFSISFKIGGGSVLPFIRAKKPDIIFAGGSKSFGFRTLRDGSIDPATLKKGLKPFLAGKFTELGTVFQGIKWGDEIQVSIGFGAPVKTPVIPARRAEDKKGQALIKRAEEAKGEELSQGDLEKVIANVGPGGSDDGGSGRKGGGGGRRGGGSNKCVRELQELLVKKGSKKTGDRPYTDADVDGQWGKNTRYAFYYYIAQIFKSGDDRRYERIKIDAGGYMRKDPGRRGWKKLLVKMDYDDSYKGFCTLVDHVNEGLIDKDGDKDEDGDKDGDTGGDEGFEEETLTMSEEEFIKKCETGSRGGRIELKTLESELKSGSGIPIKYVAINSSNLDKTKGGSEIYNSVYKAAGSETAQDPTGGFDNEEIGFGGTFLTNCAYNYADRQLYIDGNTGDYNYKDIIAVKSSRSNGWFVLVHKGNPLASGKKAVNPLNESSSFRNKKLLKEFRKYLNLV